MMRALLLLLPLSAIAADLGAIAPNNRGAKALLEDNNYKGYQNLVEAAAADSFDPTVRLNLGYAYLRNQENDKAAQEFSLARDYAGDNREVLFMANFNLGVALGAKGEIPGALAAYQAALEIQPDSQEVKTNIELLWSAQQQNSKGGGKSDQKKENGAEDDKSEGDKPNDKKNDNQKAGGQENKEDPKPQQPKPFESQELDQETVRKVLDELKAQEQRVRAEHYGKGAKERPRDKNW